jgi:hypothetical protein
MAKRQTGTAFCILALLCASVSAMCQDAVHVPALHGTSLAGSEITFPDALKDKVNIVVVGFSHPSQEQIANWGRLISADYARSTNVNYFELAMLASAPKMLRGMIIKRMGSSVPFDERGHYIPVLEGEAAWRAVTHYNKPDDAYLLLVDQKGTVLWQTEGDPTDAAYASFRHEVENRLKAADAQ